ncbi:hypothetical protein [Nocardioides aurantiacus]|nr:hypothetical protein [Nocardioides aurantiacus]
MKTETLTVMTRHSLLMYPHMRLSDDGLVAYSTVEDESGVRQRTIYLHRTTVNEMGGPVCITVTVEPGDHLNPASVAP